MAILDYDPQAEAELEALWATDEESAALLDALLIEFEDRPELLDHLCIENRYLTVTPSFEVKRFQHVWRKNYTIYILKVAFEDGRAVAYRVIYAHHPQKDIYYVLAIMGREIDYESDTEFISRICAAYEYYDIPRY